MSQGTLIAIAWGLWVVFVLVVVLFVQMAKRRRPIHPNRRSARAGAHSPARKGKAKREDARQARAYPPGPGGPGE